MSARAWLFLCLLVPLAARAADPGWQDTPLPDIKASVQLPAGWFVKKDVDQGVTVYQFTREKVTSESSTFSAGVILTVTPKVSDRAGMKPSEYAAQLLSNQDDTTVKKSTDGPWQISRVDYKIDDDNGGIQIVNLAQANDTSNTLYFVTWQSPASEDAALLPVRDKLLNSFKFDPTF